MQLITRSTYVPEMCRDDYLARAQALRNECLENGIGNILDGSLLDEQVEGKSSQVMGVTKVYCRRSCC